MDFVSFLVFFFLLILGFVSVSRNCIPMKYQMEKLLKKHFKIKKNIYLDKSTEPYDCMSFKIFTGIPYNCFFLRKGPERSRFCIKIYFLNFILKKCILNIQIFYFTLKNKNDKICFSLFLSNNWHFKNLFYGCLNGK